jgi:hypothetical protein
MPPKGVFTTIDHPGDLCVVGGYELNSSGIVWDLINMAIDFRGSRKGE